MDACCDHGQGGHQGHSHGAPAQPQRPLTPQEIEMKKKIDLYRKELAGIANFISNKGLKLKQGFF